MATIQQQITLTVLVADLNVNVQAGQGKVVLSLSPTSQFPPYQVTLMIDANSLQYIREGVPIWPVNPDLFTGPGPPSDAPAIVVADVNAMTAAGVLNLL